MNKFKPVIISLIFILLFTSCTQGQKNKSLPADTTSIINPLTPNLGISPSSLPQIVTDKDINLELGTVESIYGFSGKDISDKDFSQLSLEKISQISFDKNTKWGKAKLPKGYSPSTWLEAAKDPGLELRKLHKEGYTGRGISVAVVDKPILQGNKEFDEHNFIYTEIGNNNNVHFHGISCASILSGKNCGVAPEAKLYYFAVPNDGNNFENYTNVIDKIIELNQKFEAKEKIRIVSISDGLNEDDSRRVEWEKTVFKASDNGIMVIYSNNIGEQFTWGGCPPYKDKNNPSDYEISKAFKDTELKDKSKIIIPSDFRTTANNQSYDGYTYYGQGGWSWAIAYFAGLCTLGLQVNSSITYDQLLRTLDNTKSRTSDGYYVVNPKEYLKALEKSSIN